MCMWRAERATDNGASAGNLPLHLEVCDMINETDAGPKDAVAAIRKRLTGNSKNFHIINLTLTVSGDNHDAVMYTRASVEYTSQPS